MKKISVEDLKLILEKHQNWIDGEEDGERADLSDADLSYADLRRANLSYADLRRANLSYADLSYADLSDADLRRANLSYADLRRADLRLADLRLANLSDANLSDANLSDANLRWVASGNKSHIITIQSQRYQITYTSQIMSIGCQQHLISEWMNFDDRLIEQMDECSLEWWVVHKPIIQQWILANPAKPTKEDDEHDETTTSS